MKEGAKGETAQERRSTHTESQKTALAEPSPSAKVEPAARARWPLMVGVAACAALGALAALWAGGVFQGKTSEGDPPMQAVRPEPVATPEKQPGTGVRADGEGWVQLFNGKDLTGWFTHPRQPSDWRVEGGVLTGSGPAISYLYTERGDYSDFHLRMEARTHKGRGEICLRAPYGPRWPANNPRLVFGYVVRVWTDSTKGAELTGSLFTREAPLSSVQQSSLLPDQWFTLEVLAKGSHITVKVDGLTTADCPDPKSRYSSGHLALGHSPLPAVLGFRKIEIKELAPPKPPPLRDTAALEAVAEDVRKEIKTYEAAMKAADETLLAAFDRELATLSGTGKLRLAGVLFEPVKAEKAAFQKHGRIPWSAPMRVATKKYLDANAANRLALSRAFDRATDSYSRSNQPAKAREYALKKEEVLKPKVLAVWQYLPAPWTRPPWRCEFLSDGTTIAQSASWALVGDRVVMRAILPGYNWIDTCTLSPDGKSMAGSNQDGHWKSGKLDEPKE